jgi:hypothetical protein
LIPSEQRQNPLHFFRSQDGRQPLGTFRTHDTFTLRKRLPEDVIVEKQQSCEGLVLCRCGHSLLDGEMGQE